MHKLDSDAIGCGLVVGCTLVPGGGHPTWPCLCENVLVSMLRTGSSEGMAITNPPLALEIHHSMNCLTVKLSSTGIMLAENDTAVRLVGW